MNDTNTPWRWDERVLMQNKKKGREAFEGAQHKSFTRENKNKPSYSRILRLKARQWRCVCVGGVNFCSYRFFFLWIDPAVIELVLSSSERHAFVFRSLMESGSLSLPFSFLFFLTLSVFSAFDTSWFVHHFTFNQSGNETLSLCCRSVFAHPLRDISNSRDDTPSLKLLLPGTECTLHQSWFIICCLCRRLLHRLMKILSLWGHAYFSHATRRNSLDRNL